MVELGTDHRTQNMSPVVAAFLGSPLYVVHRMLHAACCKHRRPFPVRFAGARRDHARRFVGDRRWLQRGPRVRAVWPAGSEQLPVAVLRGTYRWYYEVLTVGTTRYLPLVLRGTYRWYYEVLTVGTTRYLPLVLRGTYRWYYEVLTVGTIRIRLVS
jgi:hypothetical protein